MRMSSEKIIDNCRFAQENDIEPDALYAVVSESLKKDIFRIIRVRNTLFWIENHKDGSANFWILDADKPQTLEDRVLEFLRAMKFGQFKKVISVVSRNDMHIYQELQKDGVSVDIDKVQQQGMEDKYLLTIDLENFDHPEMTAEQHFADEAQ